MTRAAGSIARGLATGCALLILLPVTFSAFSYAAIGDQIENRTLRTLDGGKRTFLSPEAGDASVFIFFKPSQEHSLGFLEEVEELRDKMADKPVSWVAIVSDSFATADVEKVVKERELGIPILVDEKDELYGTLGVALHPVLGITNGQRVLCAYEPFRKINYAKVTEARVLHALGEISDDELKEWISPPPAVQGGDSAVAQRNLNMARMLAERGKLEKALGLARKAAETDPGSADAHAMIGSLLREQGDCPQAVEAFDRALAIAPEHEEAQAGKDACAAES